MADYDIITIGGGLGGAALAKAMAEHGKRVLVLERETKFKDRVRGEGMTTWGSADAKALGIYDLMFSKSGREVPWWDTFVGPMQVAHREMATTTPQALPTITFYHPEMQETLLAAAAAAGAEVRRGVKAKSVKPGSPATVTFEQDGASQTATARLVVGADGRGSLARTWGGFAEQQDDPFLRITGLLVDHTTAPDDTVRLVQDLEHGRGSILFPQGNGRMRAYLICGVAEDMRLQGDKDVPRFFEEVVKAGQPVEYFTSVKAAGPLATFDGACSWVEHPYKDGVALIGDASASTDPAWGQGLAAAVRDVRVLRDALLANDDWDAAGHAYATEHDRHFNVIHTVEGWLTQFFYGTGEEADARRGRAFPLIAQDPTRVPDTLFSGPDHPLSDEMRKKFFAEE
jgi:2-polyprenyl-6-methoxyphenol hydroxylase-like FAD-dependent oxidoreductase